MQSVGTNRPIIISYERFNYNNIHIHSKSWNYRGCGTRLALSWLLVNGFKLFSSQILFLKGPNSVNSCHYFDDVSLSNFRSCCLPWKWRQCLRPPLRNQTLIPRHPLEPFWSKAPQTKLIDQSQVQSVEKPRGSIDQPIYSTSKE